MEKIEKEVDNNMKKCIENCSEDELKELLPNIPYEKIHIVYEYCHRPRHITVAKFVRIHCIGTTTLYRYIDEVKDLYNKN